MRIEMSGETKQAILKGFFDSIEDGLYKLLQNQVGEQKEVKVKIGKVLVSAVCSDGDVGDINRHLDRYCIPINEFIKHIHKTPKSEIYVVREEKPLSLESIDERIKKLEQTKC